MPSDVSRETVRYIELVRKWNSKINLVSPATLSDLHTRHVQDSAQLASLVSNVDTWADLGSGGGFPGVVVALCRPEISVTLVESDKRKAVFLRNVARELASNITVVNERVEDVEPLSAQVVSARALAPLSRLLPWAYLHGREDTTYIFPKGVRYETELEVVSTEWQFDVDVRPSKVDKEGVILLIRNLERV